MSIKYVYHNYKKMIFSRIDFMYHTMIGDCIICIFSDCNQSERSYAGQEMQKQTQLPIVNVICEHYYYLFISRSYNFYF